jgi:hypothetical protein
VFSHRTQGFLVRRAEGASHVGGLQWRACRIADGCQPPGLKP